MSDSLRDALLDLGDVPPPADLAGSALDRVRRDRRRRTVGTLVAVALLAAAAVVVPKVVLDRKPNPTAGPPAVSYQVVGHRGGAGPAFWYPAGQRYVTFPESRFVRVSPDGRWAVVTKDTEFDQVGVVSMDRLAAAGPDGARWLPLAAAGSEWAPTGHRLLVHVGGKRSDRVAVVDPASLATRTVTLTGAGRLFAGEVAVHWAADGAGFLAHPAYPDPAFQGGATSVRAPADRTPLWSFDARGRATGSVELPFAWDVTVSPDGDRALLALRDPRPDGTLGEVYYRGYDLRARQFTGLREQRVTGWADGDHVFVEVFHQSGSSVRVLDAGTGRLVRESRIGRPGEVWLGLQLVPLAGPAPAGAIVV